MKDLKLKCYYKGELREVITIYNERRAVMLDGGGVVGLDKVKLIEGVGVKDKNGQDIYNGDIVAFDDYIYDANMDDFYEGVNRATVKYAGVGYTLTDFEKEGEAETTVIVRQFVADILAKSVVVGHCMKGAE